jgi:uncharacterized Zn finger protein (UPF0148 family)
MSFDALEDGEICPFCGTPVFFYGDVETECLACGAEFVNAEEDAVD